jgi:hypothetical protein
MNEKSRTEDKYDIQKTRCNVDSEHTPGAYHTATPDACMELPVRLSAVKININAHKDLSPAASKPRTFWHPCLTARGIQVGNSKTWNLCRLTKAKSGL